MLLLHPLLLLALQASQCWLVLLLPLLLLLLQWLVVLGVGLVWGRCP
jgi:hypothetical protein